jgi:hypothetical protein
VFLGSWYLIITWLIGIEYNTLEKINGGLSKGHLNGLSCLLPHLRCDMARLALEKKCQMLQVNMGLLWIIRETKLNTLEFQEN